MITIEILEEECESFLQLHFTEYYEKIDSHVLFIEKHKLIQTNKNMLYAYDFLDEFYQQMRSSHVEFPSDTCNLLYITLKQLHQTLDSFHEESQIYKNLFEHQFLSKSMILKNFKLEIEKAKKQRFQAKTIKAFQDNYNKLIILYKKLFYDLFLQIREEILSSLKWVINTYLLYFDAILWQDTLKSPILKRYIDSLALKQFDTKHLILHKLTTTSEVTIRYIQLKKALKAY